MPAVKSLVLTLSAQRRAGILLGIGLLTALLAAFLFGHRRHTGVTPGNDAVFTSTRCVAALAAAPNGTVWDGTAGGVLACRPKEGCRKFTRMDGLPSHEVRRLRFQDGTLTVTTPRGGVSWRNGRFQPEPNTPSSEPPQIPRQTCAAVWRGAPCVADLDGLRIQQDGKQRTVPLPKSRGTHISALLPHGTELWAALFGDGLWAFDGKVWKPLDLALPPGACEITALAETGGDLWIGTRRAGVWRLHEGQWRQFMQRDEPIDHNCQAVAMYHGDLFVSTLEDGLAVRTPRGWGHYQTPVLSSNAPRQMVVFGDRLYLRHGNGAVDAFDGAHWQRNVGRVLPRKQASALAADERRLYVAQWGGWSEFDGKTWRHYLNLPDLQGLPLTALCPDGDTLWIGTQSRGIAAFDRTTGRLRWEDERSGLPDDWITALTQIDHTLYAGTFVGGLARRVGGQWKSVPELNGQNVTATASDGSGGLFIATRSGVRHQTRDGKRILLNQSAPFLDPEAQALCTAPGGLWIGARTGLYFLALH